MNAKPEPRDRRCRLAWRLPVAALLYGLALVSPARANPSFQEKIRNKSQQLDEVNSKLGSTKRRIVILASQLEQLRKEVARNAEAMARVEKEIATLQSLMQRGRATIAQLRKDLEVAEGQYRQYLTQFSRRLLHLYRMRSRPWLGVLLKSENLSEFLRRLHYHRCLSAADTRALKTLADAKTALQTRKQALEDELALHRVRTKQAQQRNRELASLLAEEKRLLKQIAKEKLYAAEKAKKLEAASRYLGTVIEKLQDGMKRFEASMQSKSKERALVSAKLSPGTLRWPVDGAARIIRPFGETADADGIRQLSRGIDLELDRLTTVKAVARGKVMFRGRFSSVYGNVVMIDHGGDPDNVISIYSQLDSILVTNGQIVERGAPLGLVGTRSVVGPKVARLHFEIRKRADALDPLKWLAPLDKTD